MERERESFSNRRAERKILPENKVLTGRSGCAFGPCLTVIAARFDRGGDRGAVPDCPEMGPRGAL